MATPIVEFNATHTTEMLGWTAQLFDDLKIYILLIIGLFMGLYILERVIGIFIKPKKEE